MNQPIALLNTTIATTNGIFSINTISTDYAIKLLEDSAYVSYIGHESTAQIMTKLLGVEITVNREQFEQQPGQFALVFKLNGRAPEGTILSADEIEEIGYSFKLMKKAEEPLLSPGALHAIHWLMDGGDVSDVSSLIKEVDKLEEFIS